MRKIFLLSFLLLLLSFESFAQIVRPTTFDDRPICEKAKGVWRQFGNGCNDECRSKFDQFFICTDSANFACDCGKGKCWNGDSCIALKDYKKIFDEEQEQEKKILSEVKAQRQKAAKANEQEIVSRLIAQSTSMVSENPEDGGQARSNLGEIIREKNIDINSSLISGSTNAITQVNIPAPSTPQVQPTITTPQKPATTILTPNKIEDKATSTVPTVAPLSATDNSTALTPPANVPPFFLQQEKAKKAAQEAAKAKAEEEAKSKEKNNSIPPGLPEIPLPN